MPTLDSCARRNSSTALYAFTAPEPKPDRGFDLDVGVRDDLHVLRFHAKEKADGRTVRWTRAMSYISITDFTRRRAARSRCG